MTHDYARRALRLRARQGRALPRNGKSVGAEPTPVAAVTKWSAAVRETTPVEFLAEV
jgi:hypothetical protein